VRLQSADQISFSVRYSRIAQIAPMLLALAAQAAEPTGTLTLACQGTVIDKTDPSSEVAKPEPVSMGLMIDFTSNTVAGFERLNPVLGGAQVKIIVVDKTTIGFSELGGISDAQAR
jgi:hypothetical protein